VVVNVVRNGSGDEINDQLSFPNPFPYRRRRNIDQGCFDYVGMKFSEGFGKLIEINFRPGPFQYDEIDFTEQGEGFMPGRQALEHVGADKPVNLFKTAPLQFARGMDCKARSGSSNLDIIDFEQGVFLSDEFAHRQTILRLCQVGRTRLMWRASAGDQKDSVELLRLRNRNGAKQMAIVDRVETSAEAEGTYHDATNSHSTRFSVIYETGPIVANHRAAKCVQLEQLFQSF
jgi:hypothetical protein